MFKSSIQLPTLAARGAYSEKSDKPDEKLERIFSPIHGWVLRQYAKMFSDHKRFLAEVHKFAKDLDGIEEPALLVESSKLRYRLRREKTSLSLIAHCFALVREVSGRRLGMYQHDVQLLGGWAMLKGLIAEMQTGEGKTLTATLPAATVALSGLPVHVITVNDYLAKRDAEIMTPIYEGLGLTVGIIQEGMEDEDRRAAYACDVTYCTNKQLTFDYLRDRMVLGNSAGDMKVRLERLYRKNPRADRLLLRGLCFAIVDEADSVLIDEARTPLVLSGEGDDAESPEVYQTALTLVDELKRDEHFILKERERSIRMTRAGKNYFEQLAKKAEAPWSSKRHGNELAEQALSAKYLFHLDQHYLVRDDKVQIIDEYTGRTMPDRSWEQGLHQMIETKEGCTLTKSRRTLVRISYQRFFRRYQLLSGMTGTGSDAVGEFWNIFKLRIATIPTHRPPKRIAMPIQISQNLDEKWNRVVDRVKELNQAGRPVLVGTRSVEASEQISEYLEKAGLEHAVLNARQDQDEAGIVAEAGRKGSIMVATNMAGRGTDIKLGEGVAELGGLHVLITELHDARRIDRQLHGRCGRQGDPGSFETFLSFEDELIVKWLNKYKAINIGGGLAGLAHKLGPKAKPIFRMAQKTMEKSHARVRKELLHSDTESDTLLAFAGKPE